MNQFPTSSRGTQIDALLLEVARAIQLPEDRRQYSERCYHDLGLWLERPGGALRPYGVGIYPQGSQALGTTNQPWGRDEFDLDSVVELPWYEGTPLELLGLLRQDLLASDGFRPRLKALKRGWRLDYPGYFHIDLIPARSDKSGPPAAIDVPDRKLREWSPSNPRGYVEWFDGRCHEAILRYEARAIVPIPPAEAAERKAILKQAVQLAKRARDVRFEGAEEAPRSVVITTLTGMMYEGGESRLETLCSSLDRIILAIEGSGDKPIEVHNPTNWEERFSEAWDNDWPAYCAFVGWVRDFRSRLERLVQAEGLPAIAKELEHLFGEEIAGRAVERFTSHMDCERQRGALRLGAAATLTTGATQTGRVIPSHRFYGR